MLKEKKNDCYGCTACMNICPSNAISMLPDEEGFLYPEINSSKCINCNLCNQLCNNYQKINLPNKIIDIYALRLKDHVELMESQSGGAFTLLAKKILLLGGKVYGASMDETFHVYHKGIQTEFGLNSLKKTKYVQSDLNYIFKNVEKDLKEAISVLFSGTPCQINGLKTFLEQKKANTELLYTCDLICHGVPSPKIWGEEIDFMESNYGILKDVYFRDKAHGWHSNISSFVFESGKKISNNVFNTMYANGLITRSCCEQCPFTSSNRTGDFTVGDYWGISQITDSFQDEKGVSLLFINSEKGKSLFESIEKCYDYTLGSLDSCDQPQLHRPMSAHWKRATFWEEYHSKGYVFIREKYIIRKSNPLRKKIIIFLEKTGLLLQIKKVLQKRTLKS